MFMADFFNRLGVIICAGASYPTRHARACRGHPRLGTRAASKSWVAGTSPAMTCCSQQYRKAPHRGPFRHSCVLACPALTSPAVGPQLDVHRARLRALAAFHQPGCAVTVGAPQPAALPAGIRVVDAAVEAFGIEAHRYGMRIETICPSLSATNRRSSSPSTSGRSRRDRACCAGRPRCNSSPRRSSSHPRSSGRDSDRTPSPPGSGRRSRSGR